MQRASQTITIDAPAELVFAMVIDFESYPTWAPEVKRVVVLERDSAGRALDVEFRAAAFGHSTTYRLRYDYARAPEQLAWTQTSGDVTSVLDGRYDFEDLGEQTRVTYDLAVDLRVPIPPFIRSRAAKRIQSDALGALKARVESR